MGENEVQLYVYDLSHGFARQMSMQFLGTQIDAVYHTSIVFSGVEYFFGRGVMTAYPGRTHHGRPMEVISLGKTSLPVDVVLEYLESLKETYAAESYDLFAHNCNNFSNDFAMFLVGRGIPDHITSLPRRVLETPFGQMLKGQIDQAMRPVTQGPPPPRQPSNAVSTQRTNGSSTELESSANKVLVVDDSARLQNLLEQARSSCAIIFFTSASCGPCRAVYPLYDELGEELGGKATLIKVDISRAPAIAAQYSIKATPTFITFLKGEQVELWAGADPAKLRSNLQLLVRQAFPPHPHEQLRLPYLKRESMKYCSYARVPPLEKIKSKLGDVGTCDEAQHAFDFIQRRNSKTPQNAALPDLTQMATFLRKLPTLLPTDTAFIAYDLARLLLIDARVSGWLAEEQDLETVLALFATDDLTAPSRPYNFRLCVIQAACNLFSSPLMVDALLSNPALSASLVDIISKSLLDCESSIVRAAASMLAYNFSTAIFKQRLALLQNAENARSASMSQELQVDLAASLIECISAQPAEKNGPEKNRDSQETTKGLTVALARLVQYAPIDSDVLDLCKAMDASRVISEKDVPKDMRPLMSEISQQLLGKGIS